jgi:hypothetical protein
VCTRIDEVGLLTAAQRLYKQYGADVLEVIEGHNLLPKKDAAQIDNQTDKCYSHQQNSYRKPASPLNNL